LRHGIYRVDVIHTLGAVEIPLIQDQRSTA
jgi:hypothetical protein